MEVSLRLVVEVKICHCFFVSPGLERLDTQVLVDR